MRSFFIIMCSFLTIICADFSLAQQKAYTDEGGTVLLYDDGTWEDYVGNSDDVAEDGIPASLFKVDPLADLIHSSSTQNTQRASRQNLYSSQRFYIDENIKISVKNAEIFEETFNNAAKIVFEVAVLNSTKLIYPKTVSIWGYRDGSDVGGTRPSGFTVVDNFDNDLGVDRVSPKYYSTQDKGIRKGEDIELFLITKNRPVASAKTLYTKISSTVFQTGQDIIFAISIKTAE